MVNYSQEVVQGKLLEVKTFKCIGKLEKSLLPLKIR